MVSMNKTSLDRLTDGHDLQDYVGSLVDGALNRVVHGFYDTHIILWRSLGSSYVIL